MGSIDQFFRSEYTAIKSFGSAITPTASTVRKVAGATVVMGGAGLLVSDSSTTPTPTSDSGPQGPLAKLENSAFDYTMLKYPDTLGEDTRHPYYMTFYINAATESKYMRPGSAHGALASTWKVGEDGQPVLSEVQKHQQASGSFAIEAWDTGLGFQRKTRRTTTAVRLYVPDTLTMDFQHSYDEPSLSGVKGTKALAAGAMAYSAVDAFLKGGVEGGMSSLQKTARAAAGLLGEKLFEGNEQLALSTLGLAVNPQVDVIYRSPDLRSFRFDFLFAPRSPEESEHVADIIRLFKFHAAPEIYDANGSFGRYFLQPSEFDIEYSMASSVGKISTCVLETVNIDYAPQGVAFYKDGRPVYTRMLLAFKELEYITKEHIDDGY